MKKYIVMLLSVVFICCGMSSCQVKGGRMRGTYGTNKVEMIQPKNATAPTTSHLENLEQTNNVIPAGTTVVTKQTTVSPEHTVVTETTMTYGATATNEAKKSFTHDVVFGPVQLPPKAAAAVNASNSGNPLAVIGWILIVIGVLGGAALGYFGWLTLGIKVGGITAGSGALALWIGRFMADHPTWFALSFIALVTFVILDHMHVFKSGVVDAVENGVQKVEGMVATPPPKV